MKELYENFLIKYKDFCQIQIQDLELMQDLVLKEIEAKYLGKDESHYDAERLAKHNFIVNIRPPVEREFLAAKHQLLEAIDVEHSQ